MKVRHSTTRQRDRIQLQMTPMIDIVFQLLVFFIMTFKIVAQEGDFNIKMPLAAPAAGPPSEIAMPPIKVRILSDANGRLAGVYLNDRALGTQGQDPLETLRLEIIVILGDDRGPGSIQETTEVELDCDYELNYELNYRLNCELNYGLNYELNHELNYELDNELHYGLNYELNYGLNNGLNKVLEHNN